MPRPIRLVSDEVKKVDLLPRKKLKLNLKNPENIIRTASNQHNYVSVGVPRLKGKCVNCLKQGKMDMRKVTTLCDTCPGANWMCNLCFEELHS